ncbi:MAG TPA: carbamoyltransferase HypF, partial [Candidatus Hydrogenedentes bacterium]|nr:carbamoyltransferase HypF [Candidatus Hydrogenedentota bacterium]
MSNRVRIELSGVVQGVGFRPYVYSLATKLNLGGFVVNTAQGLVIELEGEQAPIDEFITALRDCPPPLAVVNGTKAQAVAPRGAAHFEIRASQNTLERTVLVSPDYATCEDCLRELRDPADRRFRYPFINCTNCGPRYTIIRDLPYDRARTTMAAFAMCADCRAEYEDPRNRRFHAEPTCCPVCGPRVWMAEPSGEELKLADAVAACTDLLGNGAIVAVKGLGGFHLACDA